MDPTRHLFLPPSPLPVLGKSSACSLTPVPQPMQPESCLCGDVPAEFLRVVLWGVPDCFRLQFSIPTPSAVPQEVGTPLSVELAMAQLVTMHVLAQLRERLNLGFQSEESEWKKYVLSHLLPPSPTPLRAALLQSWCPLVSPTSSCEEICCPSQPRYPKVSVSC